MYLSSNGARLFSNLKFYTFFPHFLVSYILSKEEIFMKLLRLKIVPRLGKEKRENATSKIFCIH